MRYIDPGRINNCKPNGWDANSARWKILVGRANNKSKKISDIGNKWSNFKVGFIREFGDKCWYTEAPRVGADNDVDHFRPKGGVKLEDGSRLSRVFRGKLQQHKGYWWLAFESSNYRYSCVYANRLREEGGKGEFFPLEEEGTRAWASSGRYAIEVHTLLDPCKKEDVELIEFDHEPGRAISRYTIEADSTAYHRFDCSELHYNLNSKTIKDERILVLKSIDKDITLLRESWTLSLDIKQRLEGALMMARQSVIDACHRKSKFSAAAVSLIKRYRTEPWLADVIPHCDLEP
jgi:hypothetical protein